MMVILVVKYTLISKNFQVLDENLIGKFGAHNFSIYSQLIVRAYQGMKKSFSGIS